ncbi:class I SAM-dependent methyltransferase [Knoellia sp. Soil729]|uniref:class I SAM-dependent methyltransferase n=1 Tax=Knoellia sp. Soil729 TaxID=1736394 RepID=UPI0006F48C21|nr:class I SAM-dependent methyltransferase [Knoellia sp. Soil729]KRE42582.1 hypothetical protein ASG74_09325 [Knoellia sp. Soil729]
MSVTEVATWPLVDRLLWQARKSAFPPGEFVGQESFVSATEILWLAERAGVRDGVRVLDLCCGVGGPGLLVARQLGCDYLGVDADPDAVAGARLRAADQGVEARFDVATVPPLPPGNFDVVMLLETLLAFRDKRGLLAEVAAALSLGGRFVFTVEAGRPLSAAERAAMPDADTVWLTTFSDLQSDLASLGLRLRWLSDRSATHRRTVDALVGAYIGVEAEVRAAGEEDVVAGLISSHRLWAHWLGSGRVRKFAGVAERVVP